ncbi:MAG: AAA family ATPase [Chloroflexota bacterium]
MQRLPIGEQHFGLLRESNQIYIDKTKKIHELMNVGRFVFLARPRRFGKSLLTTTLQAIYQGKQELFNGLWIEDKIDWKPSPVILLNFNDINYLDRPLTVALEEYIDRLAERSDVTLRSSDYKSKFQEFIVKLSVEKRIVLIIDEYDKPITDFLGEDDKVKENIRTLKSFYSVLKSTDASHLHFTFITGVSKYGKISIFSDLNNLLDMTTDARFGTLLGITQQELETYFPDYLERLAKRFDVDHETLLKTIAHWYNGYSWDGVESVYVPFSTLVFLEKQTFENHWFSTGTPTFLIKLLRQNKFPAYKLEDVTADDTLLDQMEIDDVSIESLLFQTGYLTIKEVRSSLGYLRYKLGYPNYEVAQSFRKHLLADYLDVGAGSIGRQLLFDFEDALNALDMDAFIMLLKSMFSRIPNTLFLPQEAYYHSIVYLLLELLGFDIDPEKLTNIGRIDAVLETDETVIMEFKMSHVDDEDPADVALTQIQDKQYALPYATKDKRIIALGVVFDYESRNVVDWDVEG